MWQYSMIKKLLRLYYYYRRKMKFKFLRGKAVSYTAIILVHVSYQLGQISCLDVLDLMLVIWSNTTRPDTGYNGLNPAGYRISGSSLTIIAELHNHSNSAFSVFSWFISVISWHLQFFSILFSSSWFVFPNPNKLSIKRS